MDSPERESGEEFFMSLERSELQRRCKEQNIKANLSTKKMAEILINRQKGKETPMRYLKSQSGAKPSTSARKSEVGGSTRKLSDTEQDGHAEGMETGRRRLQLSPVHRVSIPEEKQEDEDKGSSQEEIREELPVVQAPEFHGDGMQEDAAQPVAAAGITVHDDASIPEKPAAVLEPVCPDSSTAASVAPIHEKQGNQFNSTDTAPNVDSAGTDVAEAAVTAATGSEEQSDGNLASAEVFGDAQVSLLLKGCPLPVEDRSGNVEAAAQGTKTSEDSSEEQRDGESAKSGSSAGAEPADAAQAMARAEPVGSDVADELMLGQESEATQAPAVQDSQAQAIAPSAAPALSSWPASASPAPSAVHPASVADPATAVGPHLAADVGGAVVFGAVGPSESLVVKVLEAERRDEEERSKPLTAGRTPLKSLMLANQDHMRKERKKAREDHARKQRDAHIQAARGMGTPVRCTALPTGVEHRTDAANGASNAVTTPAMRGQS